MLNESDAHTITSQKLKAARALLDVTQAGLASIVGVGPSTIHRIESKPGRLRCSYETATLIRDKLRERGIRFVGNGVTQD